MPIDDPVDHELGEECLGAVRSRRVDAIPPGLEMNISSRDVLSVRDRGEWMRSMIARAISCDPQQQSNRSSRTRQRLARPLELVDKRPGRERAPRVATDGRAVCNDR